MNDLRMITAMLACSYFGENTIKNLYSEDLPPDEVESKYLGILTRRAQHIIDWTPDPVDNEKPCGTCGVKPYKDFPFHYFPAIKEYMCPTCSQGGENG